MCSNSVLCPLCSHTSFSNIDSLRICLIKAANGPLLCPICNDVLQGLDKLTIHLFCHTSYLVTEEGSTIPDIKRNNDDHHQQQQQQHQPQQHLNQVEKFNTHKSEVILGVAAAPITYENGSPTISNIFTDVYVNQPKCDICGLTFRSIDLLHMHMKFLHGGNDSVATSSASDAVRYHQCHLCAKVFKMKGSLRVHLKVVHSQTLGGQPRDVLPRLSEKIRNKGSPSETVISDMVKIEEAPISPIQIKKENLVLIETPKLSPSAKGKEFKFSDGQKTPKADSPKSNDSAKIWECDICSKSFTTKYFLKKHKRLHTGEMPYSCEICAKTFTFQQSYHKHLLYHSDEKPHVCQTCGRAFKELSTLHNHERIHSGEKPFKCENCNKCFRQRVSYLVHKRIHTGVMPYKCTACEKSFRYKVSQRTHKCTAQPPGTVVRQTGDLLQKLLHSTAILPDTTSQENVGVNVNVVDDEAGDNNGNVILVSPVEYPKTSLTEELLTKSIDDIVAESCNKMGIGFGIDIEDIFKLDNNSQEKVPSPSEQFQSLCLYSPSRESFSAHLDTIHEDSFKHLLYEVEENL